MARLSILYVLLLLFPVIVFCQDTSFINKHIFPTPVRNVFKADDIIYVKTGDGLYKRQNNNWVLQKGKFEKPYVFYDKGFYQTDYIQTPYVFNAKPMAYLIPQRFITSATMAQTDNRLFLSAGGSLFEYSISRYYKHIYEECSIRDIYLEKGLKVVSTYSGIFINDTLKVTEPTYSSGCFCKIKGGYYLCNDQLYAYNTPDSFRKILSAVSVSSGLSRKLVEFKGAVYSQNTKSINQMDSNYELKPIHQGYEYHDLEAVDSVLLFCTNTGEVFQYNTKETKLLFDVNTRIRDIYRFRNTLYFSTDLGVYIMQNMQPATLSLLANLPYSVKVVKDIFNNTWISTENGLFILPDKKAEPILVIGGVEFNRGALTYDDEEDHIYAGSIGGLYVVDVYEVVRNFLPQYLNKKIMDEREQSKLRWMFGLGLLMILILVGYIYYKKTQQPVTVDIPQKEDAGLTLDKIEQDIKTHNIMTVEGLAEYYNTNTVQLNRLFKVFDTTPGKFMKKVKLDLAREMIKNGSTIEEIGNKVGYSANYLRKEIDI